MVKAKAVDKGTGSPSKPLFGCSVKTLPEKHWKAAAETAIKHNPSNRPNLRNLSRVLTPSALCEVYEKGAIGVLTTKYWGPAGVKLGVAFMENTVAELQNKILAHMNAWSEFANVQFVSASKANAEVRISRGPGGYWSYLGTDILHIPSSQQTMNLEGFVLKTPDSEYKRVVRHETGHSLGLPHEHMRPAIVSLLDPQKTITYFKQNQGWSADEVQQQVLTPISESDLLHPTPADVLSIMCYQLPGQITKDGQPIPGGTDIDPSDAQYAASIYPKAPAPVGPGTGGSGGGGTPAGDVITIDTGKKLVTAKGYTVVGG